MAAVTKRMGIEKREARTGLMLVSPWIIGFVVFYVFPLSMALYLTFVKWDFLREPKWLGFANYKSVFENPTFYIALKNTLIVTVMNNVLSVVLGVIIAAILAKKIWGGYFFRTVLFMPSLVIGVAFSLMMVPVFGNGEFGLLNKLLDLLGLPMQKWLTVPGQAVWVLVAMGLWYIGSGVIIYLAGIKGIDPSYYEAAVMDGANGIRQFFSITIPLISPVILFQVIMGLIGGLQIFDLAVGLVGFSSGGGMGNNNSLATLVFYLYRLAFTDYNMGEAAVVGWFIFLLSLVLSLIIFRLSKRYTFFG